LSALALPYFLFADRWLRATGRTEGTTATDGTEATATQTPATDRTDATANQTPATDRTESTAK